MDTTQTDSKPVKVMKYQIWSNGKFRELFKGYPNSLLEITLNRKPTRTVTAGKYYKVVGMVEDILPKDCVLNEGADIGYQPFSGIFKALYSGRVTRGVVFEAHRNIYPFEAFCFIMGGSEILTLHEVLEIKEIPVPYKHIPPPDPRSKEMTPFRIQEAV